MQIKYGYLVIAWLMTGSTLYAQPAEQKAERSDLHGDALPDGAIARLGTVRFRHGRSISSLSYSTDGKTLASSSGDKTVRIWDSATGKELRRFADHRRGVDSAALSPDGKWMASGADFKIYLWDLSTGKLERTFGDQMGGIWQLAFTFDSKTLVSSTGDGIVRTWNVNTGKELRQLPSDRWSKSTVLTPDGKLVVRGGVEGVVRFWDVETGNEKRTLATGRNAVAALAFSADGKLLATGGYDKALIHLWDLDTGKHVRQLDGHERIIDALAFTPDGKKVVSSGGDYVIRCWDAESGKQIYSFQEHAWARIAMAPDGKSFALDAGNVIRVFETATGRERSPGDGHLGHVRSVTFVGDGAIAATGSADRTVRLWDVRTGKQLHCTDKHPNEIDAVVASPDGRLLAAGGGYCPVHLWDIATRKQVRMLDDTTGGGLAFSADGALLACSGRSKSAQATTIELRDPTGKLLRSWDAHRYDSHALAFSSDGKLLASSTLLDGRIAFWQVANGRPGRTIDNHSACRSLIFTRDGHWLFSEGTENSISLFEVATGKEIPHFAAIHGYPALALSPDERTLAAAASGGNETEIRLYDVATGKEYRRLLGHQSYVRSLTFSRDGRLLATASDDATCLIWDFARLTTKDDAPVALSAERVQTLWADLGSGDTAKAYQAIVQLGQDPKAAAFVVAKLRDWWKHDPKQVRGLIADLANPTYQVRTKAHAELERLEDIAGPALHESLGEKSPVEVRRRVELLLGRLDPPDLSPRQLHVLRALQVLERTATPEARQWLTYLSKQAPQARLTQNAKAALRRMAQSSK